MDANESSAGTPEATETSKPEGESVSELKSLADLLSVDESSEDDKPEGDKEGNAGRDSKSEAKPKKFNDLAGMLGVELDDLYKLEISSTDGEPVTIESLKDLYSKQDSLVMRELEFEEKRTQAEAKLVQAQNELRDLMAALPEKALKPEVLEKIRDKQAAQAKIERQKTLDVISEWKDEKVRERDLEGMSEHLKQYGMPANYLQSVIDHRQLKYIRDNYLREQRIRKALEMVRKGKPNPTPKSKPAGKPPKKGNIASKTKGARNKLEAIFSDLE